MHCNSIARVIVSRPPPGLVPAPEVAKPPESRDTLHEARPAYEALRHAEKGLRHMRPPSLRQSLSERDTSFPVFSGKHISSRRPCASLQLLGCRRSIERKEWGG